MTFNSDCLKGKIDLLSGGETVTIKRPGAIINTKGRLTHGASTDFDIIANIQPITGRELLMVEEGDRERQRLAVFTRTLLKIEDVLVRSSQDYQVETVEEWGPYYRAQVVLKDVP